jgi:hypothetical protein
MTRLCRINNIYFTIFIILIHQLLTISSECCDSIAITSTSVGLSYQEHQLGIYTKVYNLTVNNRPVYKQNKGDQYAYYWVDVLCQYNLRFLTVLLTDFQRRSS